MGEVTIINSNKKRSSNPEHKNNLLLISSVALFLPYDVVVFISLQSTHPHAEPGPGNCWDTFSLKKQHSQSSLFPPGRPKYTQHTKPNPTWKQLSFSGRDSVRAQGLPYFHLQHNFSSFTFQYNFSLSRWWIKRHESGKFLPLFLVFFLLTILMKIGQIP